MKQTIPDPIVPTGYTYQTLHFHQGNMTPEELEYISDIKGCKYATLAYLWGPNKDPKKDTCDAYAWSFCSKKDNPSRRLGNSLAVTRAVKKIYPTFYRNLRLLRKQ